MQSPLHDSRPEESGVPPARGGSRRLADRRLALQRRARDAGVRAHRISLLGRADDRRPDRPDRGAGRVRRRGRGPVRPPSPDDHLRPRADGRDGRARDRCARRRADRAAAAAGRARDRAASPYLPAVAATTPRLVADADLPRANALRSALGAGGSVAGPAAGAVLLAFASPAAAFFANAGTFLLSALLVGSLAAGPAFAPGTGDGGRSGVLPDLREGAAALRACPPVLFAVG